MNNQFRIAVCEDNPADFKHLRDIIARVSPMAKCDHYINGEDFLSKYKYGMYHLIFLDIYLADSTGLDIAQEIRNIDSKALIAFTTVSVEHAFDAQQYRPLLYLKKPVTVDDIAYLVEAADALGRRTRQDKLILPSGNKVYSDVPYDTITYIDSRNKRCTLHLSGGGSLCAATTLTFDMLDGMLPKPRFVRTHRSYIVNMDFIDYPNQTDFVMKSGEIVYITQKKHDKILEMYHEYLTKVVRDELKFKGD